MTLKAPVLIALVLLASFGTVTGQVTHFVDVNTLAPPGFGTIDLPFDTLTAALNAANDNDRIVVFPGTYAPSTGESFPYQLGASSSKMNLDIVSVGGAAVTIIDGEGLTSGFGILRFRLFSEGSRLKGFTITNYGGTTAAIRLGSPTPGFEASDIEITQCIISNSNPGSGIVTFGASDRIKIHGNIFMNCNDNGLWLSDISTNPAPGGGLSGGEIYNNTIVNGNNNGIRLQGATWDIHNNIIANNGNNGVFDFGGAPVANYILDDNCVFGNGTDYGTGVVAGANDLNVDPIFVNAAMGDFHLDPASPCRDAGTNALPGFVGADFDGDPRLVIGPSGLLLPDMGADEVTDVRYEVISASLGLGVSLNTVGPVGAFQLKIAAVSAGNTILASAGNFLLDPLTATPFSNVLTPIPPGGSLVTFPGPLPPVVLGVTVYSQAIVVGMGTMGTGSVRFTNAVEFSIGL